MNRRNLLKTALAAVFGSVIPVKEISRITSTCSTGSSCSHNASSESTFSWNTGEGGGGPTAADYVRGHDATLEIQDVNGRWSDVSGSIDRVDISFEPRPLSKGAVIEVRIDGVAKAEEQLNRLRKEIERLSAAFDDLNEKTGETNKAVEEFRNCTSNIEGCTTEDCEWCDMAYTGCNLTRNK